MGSLRIVDVAVVVTAMTDPEERWFRLALASVLRQSVAPRQIITMICEGNSWAEREVESLTREGFDTSRVSLHPIPMARLGSVRNAGVELVSARWVAFLDGDDIWMPEKLEKQLELAGREEAAFIGTDYVFVTSEGKRFGYSNGSNPTPSSWMVRADVMSAYPFDPEAKVGEDYFWLKKTKGCVKRIRLPVVLVEYRIRAGSISAAKANSRLRLFREIAASASGFGIVRYLFKCVTFVRYWLYRNRPYDV